MFKQYILCLILVHLASGVPISEYAAEDSTVDELIVNAANSTKEFEFFYDDSEHLFKREYDIIYSVKELEIMYGSKENESGGGSRRKRTAAIRVNAFGAKRWTQSNIPFEFHEGHFTKKDKEIIGSAMDEWTKHTCLTFEERTSGNRILFKEAGGCFSRVGMVGGAQKLGLAKKCLQKGVVLHELGHSIGLHHEQTRPDRDEHVEIRLENIPAPMEFNFQKYTWDVIKNLSIPYDYNSIMHYGKNAFSLNGKKTIRTLNSAMQDTIGQRLALSFRDIKTVNLIYNCKQSSSECTKTDSSCPGEGFVGKDCRCWCPGSPVQLCAQGGSDKNGGGKAIKRKKKVVKEKACEDQHRNCADWARIGECSKNPNYMNVYCKASCKACGSKAGQQKDKTTTASCVDLHATCAYWTSLGYCRYGIYMAFMFGNCRKSCGQCSKATRPLAATNKIVRVTRCWDTNTMCPGWARTGECRRNPAYMLKQCQLSCNVCTTTSTSTGTGNKRVQFTVVKKKVQACRDNNRFCPSWARKGECYRNAAYMRTECRKSCQLCKAKSTTVVLINRGNRNGRVHYSAPKRVIAVATSSSSRCKNYNNHCGSWALRGQCFSNRAYMHIYCRKACGLCR